MTIAALMLAPLVFTPRVPERVKYFALGVLFVNVSIGGTLTSYAAPPVLMVATTWHWDSAFMLATFGWKAALAVCSTPRPRQSLLRSICTTATAARRRPDASRLCRCRWSPSIWRCSPASSCWPTIRWRSWACSCCSLALRRPTSATRDPLILKEALLVGFFLAGLVVLGGMQRWWLQPIVSAWSRWRSSSARWA